MSDPRAGQRVDARAEGGDKEACLRCTQALLLLLLLMVRCGTKVFLVDMVRAKERLLHRHCLSCATCK